MAESLFILLVEKLCFVKIFQHNRIGEIKIYKIWIFCMIKV